MENDPGLAELARLYGIETSYHDVSGRVVHAGDEALAAMLGCLGCDAGSGAVRAREDELSGRLLRPVTVLWEGTGSLTLRVTPAEARGPAEVELVLEDGATRAFSVELSASAVTARLDEGREVRVDLEVAIQGPVPTGYHRVRARVGQRSAEGHLFSAPVRTFGGGGPRGWGVFAPTYSLRSERNSGIGDFADLSALVGVVASRGGSTVATLPLLPTFIDGPFDPSPYSPVSRLFWNELQVAIDRLPELGAVPRAQALLLDPAYLATVAELRRAALLDYSGVLVHRRRLLTELADHAFSTPEGRARIDAYLAAHPTVADYARFRAVVERQRRPFRQWPRELRERLKEGDFDAASYRYHVYCQVAAGGQLKGLAEEARKVGVGLYVDLPLGAHPDGYDAYRFGDQLVRDCGTGAPPDALFEGGQSWGFAPPHPERCSETGHAYFIACLRHQMQHAATLRIDHVMGLHRLFCIPGGLGAADGVYVRQPAAELYAAVSIESHRTGTRVVGEDLGTVPDEVRTRMARHGMGRLFVLQYEGVPEGGRAVSVPEGAVASLNTHDMPTFAGFLRGNDLETRRELGLLDAAGLSRELGERARHRERLVRWLGAQGLVQPPASDAELFRAALECLGRSAAGLALVSVDDLLGETEPQNVPGTFLERPNWRRRCRATLEELAESPELGPLLSALHRTGLRVPSEPPRGGATRSVACTRVSDLDLHLLNEGTHRQLHDVLGAHPGEHQGSHGTFFAVWAPNARAVSVVGDFNDWASGDAPLHPRGSSGVWEAFVRGVRPGDLYKFHVVGADGHGVDKADPMAVRSETPPRTASIVWRPQHSWGDDEWMASRAARNSLDAPCSIYEVHLGSFARAADGALLSYCELAPLLVAHVTRLGFTHVELMPVMEHPFYASWGYQVTGYFSATGRYGAPEDLMYLVDCLHQAGIGVIFDWVPGHFPTDAHGLGHFDGTHLYEHADPRRGFHPDWRSHIFNYGRHEVQAFLTSSALYFLERFHGDGLRVDGVASMLYLDYSRASGEWIPNQFGGRENLEAIAFLRWLNESVYARFPDVQVTAEESTAWPMVSRPTYLGGLGFGAKWDLGWMHDTLEYFAKDPIYRKHHHHRLTFRGIYAFHENFVLPLSHDEVVHGKGSLLSKMDGDEWQRFANLRLLYAYQYATPGNKLLFMGSELASYREWSHEVPLDLGLLEAPMHGGVARLIGDLNRLYRTERPLFELDRRADGFQWVDVDNAEESVLAFERRDRSGGRVLCVFNFTPVARRGYRLGVESEGHFTELINTNAAEYGGTGEGNLGGVRAQRIPAQGRPFCVDVTVPPLGAVFFRAPR